MSTVDMYESHAGGTPDDIGALHSTGAVTKGEPWHRRISSEAYLWLIVVGAIAALWLLAGSFRRVLS